MYKLQQNGFLRLSDNAFIPNDENNSHYQMVLNWIDAGNTPEPEHTIEERRAIAVQRIKAEAQTLILSVMSEVQQRNALAISIDLTNKVVTGGTLTIDEQAVLTGIRTKWAQIVAFRDESNVKESEAANSSDPESISMVGV